MVLASEFLPPAAVASMAEPTESMAGADSFATSGVVSMAAAVANSLAGVAAAIMQRRLT